jgi:hypothetical protein
MTIPAELLQLLAAAKSVTVLTGAGVSAESGLPTFRDAQTGLWAKFRPEELATPRAFRRNPRLVWEWSEWRRKLVAGAKSNPAHLAWVEMQNIFLRFHLITQNVDGLHQRAGSRNVIEHLPYGTRARDEHELAWAEQRLTDLSFIVSNDGNVKRYTNDRLDCVVFADPRAFGQIDFAMYKKPVAKNTHLGSSRRPRGCFSLKDSLKRDLIEKYEAQIGKSTA